VIPVTAYFMPSPAHTGVGVPATAEHVMDHPG
jgi:hypothetical protein